MYPRSAAFLFLYAIADWIASFFKSKKMKTGMLAFFSMILLPLSGNAQGSATALRKVHVFVRESLPGIQPRVIDEDGSQKTKPAKNSKSYLIYMEYKKGALVKPSLLWLDGVPYKVKSKIVTSPVVWQRSNEAGDGYTTDTLIRKTSHALMELELNGQMIPAPRNRQKKPADAFVLEYNYNSRIYFYPVKDFKKLSPVILQ
jgi:hypothetical protein